MKQPVSVVVLTVLAVISGIWSIINMLRYPGFSPVSPLGLLEIFKVNIIGAIFSGLTAVIWFWAAGKLLNLELQGLVFVQCHKYPEEANMVDDMELKKKCRDLKTARSVSGPTKVKAEHTVKDGDTLSHLALQYYGHATKPYWMVIYEANMALIGDNPNKVKLGITLKIPELPPELSSE